jgi:hypothetical protein
VEEKSLLKSPQNQKQKAEAVLKEEVLVAVVIGLKETEIETETRVATGIEDHLVMEMEKEEIVAEEKEDNLTS